MVTNVGKSTKKFEKMGNDLKPKTTQHTFLCYLFYPRFEPKLTRCKVCNLESNETDINTIKIMDYKLIKANNYKV